MPQNIWHGLLLLIGVLLEGISTSSPDTCTCAERHGDAAVLQSTVNADASAHIFLLCDRYDNNSSDENNNSSDDNNHNNNNLNNNDQYHCR